MPDNPSDDWEFQNFLITLDTLIDKEILEAAWFNGWIETKNQYRQLQLQAETEELLNIYTPY